MFNTFFKGTTEDFLNHVLNAPQKEIDSVQDPDKLLNRAEMIDTVVDEFKIPRDEAERIVTAIQLEELQEVLDSLVEKGLLEITEYDKNNNFEPKYGLTELGKKIMAAKNEQIKGNPS